MLGVSKSRTIWPRPSPSFHVRHLMGMAPAVYAFRPVTCRMMGIPVETPEGVEGACEVQTAVLILRVPAALREEEDRLAEREAMELAALQNRLPISGEEVPLAYGFLGDLIRR